LSYDKDNLGKFNAKQIQLNNCVFKDIEEFAINYIRTTPNLNIKGGKLVITNCVFDKVANFEKGKILRTSGIHEVVIKNSVFLNSYLAKSPIAIAGQNASISNCLISDSGFVKVTKGAQEQNIMYKKPKWEDKNKYLPSAKSPLLKENNGIDQIGLITTNK